MSPQTAPGKTPAGGVRSVCECVFMGVGGSHFHLVHPHHSSQDGGDSEPPPFLPPNRDTSFIGPLILTKSGIILCLHPNVQCKCLFIACGLRGLSQINVFINAHLIMQVMESVILSV